LSWSRTWKEHLEVRSDVSTAVHVTVVAPAPNVDPEAGLHVAAEASATLSAACTLHVSVFCDCAAPSDSVISEGQEMLGA
jgi:hypothetical protein